MLMDKSLIDTYIRKGVSEIHWEGKKLNHFDLIRKVRGNKIINSDSLKDFIFA